MPFATWIHLGLIDKSKYPISDLQAKLIERCNEYEIKTIAYDPYNGQQLGEDLAQEGITAARMAQNQTNFNEPIRDFQQAIIDGRLSHDGNPLLRWCVSNAVVNSDRSERWMFDKNKSSEKIDPLVATVMAFRIASLAPQRSTGSLYL
jgi:phage terminase large subunit-like protein